MRRATEKPRVKVSTLAKKMELENLTKALDLDEHFITVPDINRPSLQLTGFWEYFDTSRVQIVGLVEYVYMQQMEPEFRTRIYHEFLEQKVPCIIFCRSKMPDDEFVQIAAECGVPVLISDKSTSMLTAEVIRWLHIQLAPMITIHGVLVDVYGEGVLITGESGIGKSEAAIELIKRGHRLVSDDVVEIRKVSDDTLVGSAPAITRHFIELRGIGIIDVKTLFGVECVKNTQSIDLVLHLEDWSADTEYDRMGMEDQYIEYLGNKVVCHHLPVRPGRNLAVIVESAAVNHRQKKMGYNAAHELYKRVQNNLRNHGEEENDIFY